MIWVIQDDGAISIRQRHMTKPDPPLGLRHEENLISD